MTKKVVIISSSPRKDGNSDSLCRAFERGAMDGYNQVTYIRLAEKKINYCLGCYACERLRKCFQDDDLNDIAKELVDADVIVLATPVYFYTMCGQMKVFLDRLVQNYTKIHADIYIFVTAWDSDKNMLKLAVDSIRGATRDCYEDCPEKGVIMAGGYNNKGDIIGSPEMEEAYNMGKNC